MRAFTRLGTIALMIVALALPFAGEAYQRVATGTLFDDFRAFYCAARVASHGHDPYLAEPLHACESEAVGSAFYRTPPDFAIPAPLPGYTLALLLPLGRLPFLAACALWLLLGALAIVAAFRALVELTGLEPRVIGSAIALPIGLVALSTGEIAPLCIAALCMSALLLRQGRGFIAGLFAGCAMIEPQVALPACVAIALWVPRARGALALIAAAFALLSLAFLGFHANIEYFSAVLPAHAASELHGENQYSLAAIVAGLGVPDRIALVLGTLSMPLMLVIGCALARRLMRRHGDAAMLALVPSAFAVVGGPFMHVVQIAAAIPAALLLYSRARMARKMFVGALLLLAVPWPFIRSIALLPAAICPLAWLTYTLTKRNLRFALVAALAFLAFFATVHYAVRYERVPTVASIVEPVTTNELAEKSWARHMQRDVEGEGAVTWLVRLPTWIGLLLLVGGTAMDRAPAGEPR
jgi:hypothetical protein